MLDPNRSDIQYDNTEARAIATFDQQGELLHTLYYIALHTLCTLHYITFFLRFLLFFSIFGLREQVTEYVYYDI